MAIDQIIQAQIEAYNERNIIKMMSFFSPEIEIFNFAESEPVIKGYLNVEKVYKDLFETSSELNAEILNRIVFDNKVIDLERITGPGGVLISKVVAIYELSEGLIRKVHFMREKRN